MKKILPKQKAKSLYRKVLHIIDGDMEQYIECDNKGKGVVTTSHQNTTDIQSLSEILYFDAQSNLLVKKKSGNSVTHYKYNANRKLIGYYISEEK